MLMFVIYLIRQSTFATVKPYMISNPLVVPLIIGDYSNSPLSSINGANNQYYHIIRTFNHTCKYKIAFATQNNSSFKIQCLHEPIQDNTEINKFDVKVNWSSIDIEQFVEKLKNDILNTYNFDSLIFLISGHGNGYNEIYDSNGENYSLEFIFYELNNANCRSLRQKPKIYFIDTNRVSSNTKKSSNYNGNIISDNFYEKKDDQKEAPQSICQESNHNKMVDKQGILETYTKENHCRKIFGNIDEQMAVNASKISCTEKAIFIKSFSNAIATKIVQNKLPTFDDILFETRGNIASRLRLHSVNGVVLHDFNTMPYPIQFCAPMSKHDVKHTENENEPVIQSTVSQLCRKINTTKDIVCFFCSILLFSFVHILPA